MERERSFVADASHELRTPLAHLQAEVELALEAPRTRGQLAAALREVGIEPDRLSQLAADLLLLARADRGNLPLRLDDVALDELLDGVTTRFARRARASAGFAPDDAVCGPGVGTGVGLLSPARTSIWPDFSSCTRS